MIGVAGAQIIVGAGVATLPFLRLATEEVADLRQRKEQVRLGLLPNQRLEPSVNVGGLALVLLVEVQPGERLPGPRRQVVGFDDAGAPGVEQIRPGRTADADAVRAPQHAQGRDADCGSDHRFHAGGGESSMPRATPSLYDTAIALRGYHWVPCFRGYPKPKSPVQAHRESMRSVEGRACFRRVGAGFGCSAGCRESMAPNDRAWAWDSQSFRLRIKRVPVEGASSRELTSRTSVKG